MILMGGSLGDVQRRCLRWSRQESIFFAIACCLAERGFVPSVGLGEIVVLCDGCRIVPEGRFVLVGYTDPCVRYDLLSTVGHWRFVTYHGALVICYVPWGIGDLLRTTGHW
jgi:hypothetical protein